MTKEQETLKYLSAMRVIDFNKLGFVYGKKSITDTLDLLKNKKIELEKKDKIIDEMAKYLASIDFDEQCLEISEPCLGCPKEDDLDGYMYCIKQYFEKKVEKESD